MARVRDGIVQPDVSVRTEAATFVSLVYGAMLAARAYGNAGMFRDVTGGAVERLAVPRTRG
ncbi:hypothetical protein [Burkholderia contaminans]|uniref:hypothetical protein n=1 Tax=Burkholderia contaminans TaxID=488447 RepID=UPI00162670FA|nr:hypothetical protein [Burkholderia contaminans]